MGFISRLCVAGFALLAMGCSTMRYMPVDGALAPAVAAPAELAQFSATVESDFDLPGGYASPAMRGHLSDQAGRELAGWFDGEGDDLRVTLRHENTKDRGYLTMLVYFGTLGLLPSWVTTEGESVLQVSNGEQVLFENREPYRYRSALSVLLPSAMAFGGTGKAPVDQLAQDQLNRHKLAMGKAIAGQMAAYESAVSEGTVTAYRQYLQANPGSLFRMETLSRLAALAPEQDALAYHRANLELDEAYLLYLPDNYDIWFVGPEGMRVHEVLSLSSSQDEVLLVSRIKAAGQPYKVFDAEEIALLEEGGLSAGLIAAMIDASAAGAPAQPSVAAPAEPMPVTATAAAAGQGETAPGVTDIAAQCAKRYAALKACDQVPSFGANICRSQVKKTYSHLACELIQ